MYIYDDFDRTLVDERVREFRGQVARRLSGELTEEEFKPLRLMNAAYLGGVAAPASDAPPRVLLPAAQVQGCAHLSGARSRCDQGSRHWSADASKRSRRDRLRGDRWRRARAHPLHRKDNQALPAEA